MSLNGKYGLSDGEKLKDAEKRAKAALRPIDEDALYVQLRERAERLEKRAVDAEADAAELKTRNAELEKLYEQTRVQLLEYQRLLLSRVLTVVAIEGKEVKIGAATVRAQSSRKSARP